jgi:hypothetical protein
VDIVPYEKQCSEAWSVGGDVHIAPLKIMTYSDINKHITLLHTEIDALLAAGGREAIMKSIAILNNTWAGLFSKDDGIRSVYYLQKIWMDEVARGEPSVFADVHSVAEALAKTRLIRHSFMRLENGFPTELCLEALQNIAALNLSQTAFHEILKRDIEDGEKVIARIAEITSTAMNQ